MTFGDELEWYCFSSLQYRTQPGQCVLQHYIFDTSVPSIKHTNPLENTCLFSLTLLIYIQIHSKWWNAQSTMEGRAQMDGQYKHQIIGMTKQHTGMRGGDGLSIGHASGRGRGRVKPGLVGWGVLWEQSHRYCLAMQRRADWQPSLLCYSSLQFVHPSLIYAPILELGLNYLSLKIKTLQMYLKHLSPIQYSGALVWFSQIAAYNICRLYYREVYWEGREGWLDR